MKRSPLIDYVKAAFLWRWNLLAFGAAVAFGILSGKPDVVLPLAAAAEIAYIGLLTSQPRFRKAVDVKTAFGQPEVDDKDLLREMKTIIKRDAWARYEALRDRCLSLNRLAAQFRGPHAPENETILDLQTSSLERLLWMFLKLLYSQDALSQFLRGTDRGQLQRELERCEKQLKDAADANRDPKFIRSLQDKQQTLKQRLDNYDHAYRNLEFIGIELDRIEQKVNAIAELAINAPNAMDITAQVDGIAEGISATEEAMRDFDIAPVLQKDTAPRLLREEA